MNQKPECIVCGQAEVEMFLDLGETALANRFLAESELGGVEPLYPLRTGLCADCGHVQLLDRVPPGEMFDDYLYVSGASDTLTQHFDELSRTLIRRFGLGKDDLLVDIGCNDGTLLSAFRRNSGGAVTVVGIDPARNLAEASAHLGIPRYVELFNTASAERVRQERGPAAVITATNTFPHIQDLGSFVTALGALLRPGGTFVAEAHYLGDMLDQVAFDTIYHEHVSYWSLAPLQYLMRRYGMEVTDVEHLPIHHGQMRVYVQRQGEGVVSERVGAFLEQEKARGLRSPETYRCFAQQVARIRRDLCGTLAELAAGGNRVVGYGAPAKGNTLLTYLNLGTDQLSYIVDRSPLKQGRYTPGMHIPVVSPGRLMTDRPEYVLLLAWNFQDEVLAQQADYRAAGGRFITPVPEVRII